MPYAIAGDGTRIAYEELGPSDGEPVLCIQGLGADRRGWLRQRRALGERYRTVVFDNRGVGGSDRPPGPYDLMVMAGDARAVLDAAGMESAHVLGASMGGVLAQLLAVVDPDRVRSLVLACTACRHHRWRRELLDEWADIAGREGMAVFAQEAVRWLVGPRTLRRFRLTFGALGPVAMNGGPESFVAQVAAILDLDDGVRAELRGVRVPTMVVVGSQDILTPLGDSEEIASLIPGAELAVVTGGAHGFMVEQAPAFNRVVRSFLDRTA